MGCEKKPTFVCVNKQSDMVDTTTLNKSNKDYNPAMHTAEHILNQTMVRTFGCGRSRNAHIEKKKSKCDYLLAEDPGAEKLAEVERKVNEVIAQHLPVRIDFLTKEEAKTFVDLSKLPDDVSETIRIVRVGDYDACACIGEHVGNKSEIGRFQLLNCDYEDGRLRVRFKVAD
jgi:Ser-tRNA(Ala) deacylase AlaX